MTVGIGTDNVAANNSYDLIAEMRVAGLVASHREGRAQPISSRELVRMATVEGAKALGLDQEIGDLRSRQGGRHDRHRSQRSGLFRNAGYRNAARLFRQRAQDVCHVWVAGEQIVRDRKLTRRDYADVRTDYSVTYNEFWARVADARLQRKTA